MIATSAVSPSSTRFLTTPADSYVTASVCPVARSNRGASSVMAGFRTAALSSVTSAAHTGEAPIAIARPTVTHALVHDIARVSGTTARTSRRGKRLTPDDRRQRMSRGLSAQEERRCDQRW